MFYLSNIFCTLGLLVFIILAGIKVFVHYFILDPLIKHKLSETVEEDDPDFDWNKYINWK